MTDKVARSLQAELHARLQEIPEGKALTFVDGRGRFAWRTFAQLHAEAARCASVFASRGAKRGDVCVLVMPSNEECCHALLGCLLIGAIPVLIAPPVIRGLHSNLLDVIAHVVRKTSARLLIVGEDGEIAGESLGAKNPKLTVLRAGTDWRDGDPAGVAPVFPRSRDIAAMQLTSGTTGRPKICVWEQHGVLASLDGMHAAMRLSATDTFLNWTPLYHDMGLVNNFLLCMVQRVPLAMIETMDFLRRPPLWLQALSLTGATTTWSPNFGYALATQRIRDQDVAGVRLDHVRGFWNAAERIHLQTIVDFQRRFESVGVRASSMKTNFGCAENVGGATFSDPDERFVVERVNRSALFENGIATPLNAASESAASVELVSVGRTFPGMTAKILSPAGRALPDGRVGEIALKTPSRMRGYLANARETQRAIKGDLLRTGDLGYLRGREVFWVGRGKERINLHGKKYDPSDFEQALLDVEGLRKGCFAAFGVDDISVGTQRLVIVSETAKPQTAADEDIVKGIEAQMTKRMGIGADEVLLLDYGTMSKTSSGKRRHRFYRAQYTSGALASLPGARSFRK